MQTTRRINVRHGEGKTKDIKSLLAYSNYLVKKAQLSGNLCFDGHRPTEEESRVAEECRILCGRISRSLNDCKMNEIPGLLDYYDIAYRIGNGTAPDTTFISLHRQRVFNAWKSGDKEIEESTVFGIVTSLLSHQPGGTYMTVYRAMKEDWTATLRGYGYFPKATACENYNRLALTMRGNIDEELGYDSEELRYEWYLQNRVEDITTLGSQLLKSYRRFVSSLFPHVLDYDEVAELDNLILTELSTRPDLHPYDRQAYILALEYSKEMV